MYDIIEKDGLYYVYGPDRSEALSWHKTIADARAAIKRYRAADKRRAR